MTTVRRHGAVMAALVLGLAWQSAAAPTAGAEPSDLPPPSEVCTVTDDGLTELSGLASDGQSWFATDDGGTSLSVSVLDPADCTVRRELTAPVDPYDVEDLALGTDGAVWLADTGDNRSQRDTVGLHVLHADGRTELYRLTYPDGPHDAEALLLDAQGVPHIVTKQPFGEAGVYRPSGPLLDGATVALNRIGSVRLGPTDTTGGPTAGSVSSVLVTGGSVSPDGRTVALRTYTDAYLFTAPDGDLEAALSGTPLRVPLPHEPQGEAVALEPDGSLLSASEGSQPVRRVPDAVGAAQRASATSSSQDTGDPEPVVEAQENSGKNTTGQNLLIAAGFAALIVFLGGKLSRRK